MAASKLLLRCPYCDWPFEAKPPDRLHFAYSFERPLRGSYHENVIKESLFCQNPACKNSITIYWYAPMSYFDRI